MLNYNNSNLSANFLDGMKTIVSENIWLATSTDKIYSFTKSYDTVLVLATSVVSDKTPSVSIKNVSNCTLSSSFTTLVQGFYKECFSIGVLKNVKANSTITINSIYTLGIIIIGK